MGFEWKIDTKKDGVLTSWVKDLVSEGRIIAGLQRPLAEEHVYDTLPPTSRGRVAETVMKIKNNLGGRLSGADNRDTKGAIASLGGKNIRENRLDLCGVGGTVKDVGVGEQREGGGHFGLTTR